MTVLQVPGGLHHLADQDGEDPAAGDREAERAADPGQGRHRAGPLRRALQGGQPGGPELRRGGREAAAPRGLVQELPAVQRAVREAGGRGDRRPGDLQQPHHPRHPQVTRGDLVMRKGLLAFKLHISFEQWLGNTQYNTYIKLAFTTQKYSERSIDIEITQL